MIKRFIRHIRQKPKAVRNNIALGLAAVFTGIVATIWAYHFPQELKSLGAVAEADPAEERSAFGSLFTNFKDQFAELKQSATAAQTEVEAEAETVLPVGGGTPPSTPPAATPPQNSLGTTETGETVDGIGQSAPATSSAGLTAPAQSIRIVTVNQTATTAATTSVSQ